MKIYGPEIAEGSEVTNLTVSTGTAFPTLNVDPGEMFFRTDTSSLYVYTGTAWETAAGIDSGLLDGLDSTQFLRSDAEDIYSPDFFILSSGVASLSFDGTTAPDGKGLKRITCNDGYGNWNFRAGHYANAGEKHVNATDGASAMIMASDATSGSVTFKVAGVGGATNALVSWTHTLLLDTSAVGLYFDGNEVWHAGNDGNGSGLDADTIDGINGAAIVRSDVASQSMAATTLTFSGASANIVGPFGNMIKSSDEWLRLNDATTHTNGIYCNGAVLRTDGQLQVGASGSTFLVNGATITHQGNTVWTAGNDGSGSGLDADKWDGGHKTISTAAPSGGADGDVWFQYIA